ncbi:MAG: hypothetical protein JO165_07380 [Candidatus Eremiobacteraeota bacterium]|nr:hypothetical protein [Candidatus Eremiobacteraeota bacterium]
MIEAVRQPVQRTVEFGIYRDGDNNLDDSQHEVLDQARAVSRGNRGVEFTVQDTSSMGGANLVTQGAVIADGQTHQDSISLGKDMASPQNLTEFVAHVLDNAEKSGAKQTWIELVDHGAGDGGGLEADTYKAVMPMPKIANAIAAAIALHAKEHPEDAQRGVDGVVANQCLMSSLGFADALSHAGVKYLAASPETMLSPGVPSQVANAIENHLDDPSAMAKSVVGTVMRYKYDGGSENYGPAAAFDVLDVSRNKLSSVERNVKKLNDAIADAAANRSTREIIREDAKAIDGMVRFPQATPDMPWHADRPAIALYDALAQDGRLAKNIRDLAASAEASVKGLVLAHKESRDFAPFDDASYTDAGGPTVHFAVNARQLDPWAPHVSETKNRFYSETDAGAMERVIA